MHLFPFHLMGIGVVLGLVGTHLALFSFLRH
jgi:hypothetical protein